MTGQERVRHAPSQTASPTITGSVSNQTTPLTGSGNAPTPRQVASSDEREATSATPNASHRAARIVNAVTLMNPSMAYLRPVSRRVSARVGSPISAAGRRSRQEKTADLPAKQAIAGARHDREP